jgi:peptidyl-prolyl cis-trans isomerase C
MSNCTVTVTKPESKSLPGIRVNGEALDETLYAQELQYHPAKDFGTTLQKAGQALVIRQLLMNEIKKNSTENDKPTADEEEAIQTLLDKHIAFQEPSEDDCKRYFANNPDRFKSQALLQVEHILLAAPKDDLGGRDRAKKAALSIIKQLKADPALFAALAEQFSVCPSKKTGGSLGQIGKGQTVPEFEKQIMRLSVGLAEVPIESRYGFHVVRLNKKIEGKPLEYSMVAEKIRGYLTQKASQLSIQAYIQSLVEKADIEGIKMGFSDKNIYI